ncbi:MAG TPA: hypothetical protein VLJ39_14690 [Tepidisphaeraceae bacterium]|nr:hypothetical protein [Tepidisphaeraceae bacterium]
MRTLMLIPVAYVAGIEGFGIFMPYLLFVCVVATMARAVRRRLRLRAEGAVDQNVGSVLELESAAA